MTQEEHCTHNIKVIDNAVDKKNKLYLQIIMQHVEAAWSPVKNAWFSVRKNDTHRAYITL